MTNEIQRISLQQLKRRLQFECKKYEDLRREGVEFLERNIHRNEVEADIDFKISVINAAYPVVNEATLKLRVLQNNIDMIDEMLCADKIANAMKRESND